MSRASASMTRGLTAGITGPVVRLGGAAAEFSNVACTGSVSAQWQVMHRVLGNSPDDLHVALQDTAGRMGVAVHPDPAAVNFFDWSQWTIPLSRFAVASADLKSIKRMYLGVGDRNHPHADGTGMLLIDDIRVIRPASRP